MAAAKCVRTGRAAAKNWSRALVAINHCAACLELRGAPLASERASGRAGAAAGRTHAHVRAQCTSTFDTCGVKYDGADGI